MHSPCAYPYSICGTVHDGLAALAKVDPRIEPERYAAAYAGLVRAHVPGAMIAA